MSAAPAPLQPTVDLPSLAVRWEGLVVSIDAVTLNTLVRQAMRRIEGVEDVVVDPENGRLGLTIRFRKVISFSFRGHLVSLKFKDGFLGFSLADASVGGLPIPNWLIQRVVERGFPGRALFYPEERVIVMNFASMLPPELSVEVKDVACENGELKLFFGPSQYRLDRVIRDLGKDPFADD